MGNCFGKKEGQVVPLKNEKKFEPVSPTKPPERAAPKAPETAAGAGNKTEYAAPEKPARAESSMLNEALKTAAAVALAKQEESSKPHYTKDEKGIKFKDRKAMSAYQQQHPDEEKPLILTYDYEEMTRALVGAYEMGTLEKAMGKVMADRRKKIPIDVIIRTRAVLEACYYRVLEQKVKEGAG